MDFKPVARCGTMIRARCFDHEGALSSALADTLAAALRAACARPTAIMLAGGSTPLAAYGRLAALGLRPDPLCRVLFSDDRLVPPDHAKSNFHHIAPLFRAAGLAPHQILRVRGEVPLAEAASEYHAQLESFFASGGEIALGVLGLGADGHTASLFSAEDIARGQGRYAVGVQRPDGLAGVSVTPALLRLVSRLVFVVAGDAKRETAAALLRRPPAIAAAIAINDHPGVELWTDRAAWPL